MPEVGDVAPDFTLPDLDGRPTNLRAALQQGPVVLAFWKAECATTRLTFPYLERLRRAYPSAGWQLWGVGQDEVADVAPFLQQVGSVSFPLLVDFPDYTASSAYDPPATPTLVFVEPNQTI